MLDSLSSATSDIPQVKISMKQSSGDLKIFGRNTAAALREGAETVEAMRSAYDRRRLLLVGGLRKLGFGVPVVPKGAFYVFPNIGGLCERLGVHAAYAALPTNIRAQTSPATLFQMFLLYTMQTNKLCY